MKASNLTLIKNKQGLELGDIEEKLDFNARGGTRYGLVLYLAIPKSGRPIITLISPLDEDRPGVYPLLEVEPGESITRDETITRGNQAIKDLGFNIKIEQGDNKGY